MDAYVVTGRGPYFAVVKVVFARSSDEAAQLIIDQYHYVEKFRILSVRPVSGALL